MELTVLGCSGGIGGGRETTSFLLNDALLIDAGTGVSRLSREHMCAVQQVVLTHPHMDHIAALPMLVDARHDPYVDGLAEALTVCAAPASLQALKNHVFNDLIWPDFTRLPSPQAAVLRLRAIEPQQRWSVGDVALEAVAVAHPPQGLGFIAQSNGVVVAFSGDTTSNTSLWAALNRRERLDFLLVECAFPNAAQELAQASHHYCPRLLAQDLRQLRHRPRLGLTHFKPGYEQTILGECAHELQGWDWQALHSGESLHLGLRPEVRLVA